MGAGRGDRSGGISLAAAATMALVWANWPGSVSYAAVWSAVAPWSHALGLDLSVRDWINDGLMVGFFTLVGIEIRRETSGGELRSWRQSASPILAAGAGMALPALIYLAAVQGHPGAGGWGIPMATDVAFALGALALVAPRGSGRARVFLMTLAVADDIGSVIVLVAFYSADVVWVPLVAGLGCLAAMGILHVRRLLPWWACVALGALSWWAFVNAGVEPAVVGVVVGWCLVPLPPGGYHRGERLLEPFVNLAILPLFALANVGVRLVGSGLGSGAALRVLVAVAAARLVGKPVAIAAATFAVTRLAGPGYDPRLERRALFGVGALASIGFTVPLLIIRAALPDGPLAAGATAGLLIATALGVATGAVLLRSPAPPTTSARLRPEVIVGGTVVRWPFIAVSDRSGGVTAMNEKLPDLFGPGWPFRLVVTWPLGRMGRFGRGSQVRWWRGSNWTTGCSSPWSRGRPGRDPAVSPMTSMTSPIRLKE